MRLANAKNRLGKSKDFSDFPMKPSAFACVEGMERFPRLEQIFQGNIAKALEWKSLSEGANPLKGHFAVLIAA
jgi:hypothetical protein